MLTSMGIRLLDGPMGAHAYNKDLACVKLPYHRHITMIAMGKSYFSNLALVGNMISLLNYFLG